MQVERRRRLREEISLILPAIFIAVVVWAIAKQQKLETNWVTGITVNMLNVPANMDVTRTPPDVRIQVRYPAELHNWAVARNFSFSIDASRIFRTETDQISQSWKYQVDTRDIQKHNLPETIQVVQVDPPYIQLDAMLRTTTATVETVTTGQLPRNMEMTDQPQPRPEQVTVTGSAEALQRFAQSHNTIKTTPIDLSALQSSQEVYPKLVLPPGIQIVGRNNATITVDIGLTERIVKRIYESVPVTVPILKDNIVAKLKPETVSIEVEGPDTALRQLTNEDFEVIPARDPSQTVGQAQKIGIEAHLKVTASAPRTLVRMVRCIPNSIEVQFVNKPPVVGPIKPGVKK
ncbi:MAG: YbbR-like domain-containing protein [Candidatus Sumerlaeia bacterium]